MTAFDIPSNSDEQVQRVASKLHRLATSVLIKLTRHVKSGAFLEGIIEREEEICESESEASLRTILKNTPHFPCLVFLLARCEPLRFSCKDKNVLQQVSKTMSLISPLNLRPKIDHCGQVWKTLGNSETTQHTVLIDEVSLGMTFDCQGCDSTNHYTSTILHFLNNPRLPEKACSLKIENLKYKYMSVVRAGVAGRNLTKLLVSMNIPATESALIEVWRRNVDL